MPLENIKLIATAKEAVSFATSDHGPDKRDYNLERPGSQPYPRDEVEALLRAAGYRKHQSFSLDFRFERPEGHAIGWIRPSHAHPRALELLKEFISRPTDPVEDRFLAFHREHNAIIQELLKSNLLTFELRPAQLEVYCTMFAGNDRSGKAVGQEDVVAALLKYHAEYTPPRSLERTEKGEYRLDRAHVSDPNNPHGFPHLHVLHKLKPYETTLRVT